MTSVRDEESRVHISVTLWLLVEVFVTMIPATDSQMVNAAKTIFSTWSVPYVVFVIFKDGFKLYCPWIGEYCENP